MDLNPLGSKGGTALLRGAAASSSNNEEEVMEGKEGEKKNRGLRVLSLAGCGLGDECWDPLVEALTSSLRFVCLAANSFTQVSKLYCFVLAHCNHPGLDTFSRACWFVFSRLEVLSCLGQ